MEYKTKPINRQKGKLTEKKADSQCPLNKSKVT